MESNPKMMEIDIEMPGGATLTRIEIPAQFLDDVMVLTFDNGHTLTIKPRIVDGIDAELEWEWGTDGNA